MQPPDRLNLARYVLTAGFGTPQKTALEVLSAPGVVSESWTYSALTSAILATANNLLTAGLRKGDFLILRLGNVSDFPILYLGSIAAGIVPVPSSPLLTHQELARQIKTLGGKGAVICADDPPHFPGWQRFTPQDAQDFRDGPGLKPIDSLGEDPAYIVFTSGTGAAPKAVTHAHRAIWARRMMWQDWYGLHSEDRVLHAGAFNWTYTLGTGLMDPWSRGATALIYAGPPDRNIWPKLAKHHTPSIFAAAPGVYRQMLDAPDLASGFSKLRHGLSAGETLPQSVRDHWCKTTGKPIYEALGMSEISTFISSSPTTPHRTNTAGKAQSGRRIAILNEDTHTPLPENTPGLLAIHRTDPGLMLGYHNDPHLTQAQFASDWFITGDRASCDDDGYITHLGRSDDVLNAGGYRVSPLEVEAAVQSHPDITECAAVELPVKADASVITVFYVAKHANPAVSELEKTCAQVLAPYKQPRAFRQLDALPRNANGKLRRQTLVETYGWRPAP